MPFIERGGSKIYFESHGDGPPIVFAHGVGGNHASWFYQVPEFSKSNRVIVFDHRAFGNSTDEEQIGCSAYVDDLLALLDGLQVDQAVLVGQSMGGGTVSAFTARHPDRVKGVLIADSLAGIQVDEPLASELAANNKANADLSQAERVLGPVMREDDPALTMLYLQIASFNSVTVKTVRGTIPVWSPDDLAKANLPILFVAGEHDILFRTSAIKDVQSRIPNSQYSELLGAGHSAYFERPKGFNACLRGFLEELDWR